MDNKETSLTVFQAARALRCTSGWIRVLLWEQRLPGACKVAGEWRIPQSAVEKIRQRREQTAVSA